MFSYAAVLWNPRNPRQEEQARHAIAQFRGLGPRWTTALLCPGLSVQYCGAFDGSDRILELGGDTGVVIGTLFTTPRFGGDVPIHATTIGNRERENILASAGRSLIKSHWGSYILLLKPPTSDTVLALRSPVGRLPCFYTDLAGVQILVSRVADLVEAGIRPLSVNLDCVRAQAIGGDYLTEQTSIKELKTLVPGEALCVSASGVGTESYWSMRSLARDAVPATSFDEAVAIMKERTHSSIRAWTAANRAVLVAASGGFDSSVVLACTRQSASEADVVAFNFYDHAAADERSYARSMARKVGVRLVERELDQRVDFQRFLSCALTAAPVLHFTAIDIEPALVQLAEETGATAAFSGEIGDDIFGRTAGPELIADSIQRLGYGISLLGVVADFAQYKRLSVARSLSFGRRYLSAAKQWPYWSLHKYKQFVAPEIGNEHRLVPDDVLVEYERCLSDFIHPWCKHISEVPLGWCQLVNSLVMATTTWSQSPFASGHESIFVPPLANQLLVEGYARIPAHMHIRGGHSGAVARAAFGEMLSTEVRARGRSKGTPDMWLINAVEKNSAFLRDLLLDGVLIQERVLDRKKLEKALARDLGSSRISVGTIIVMTYIESWLRRWASATRRLAA